MSTKTRAHRGGIVDFDGLRNRCRIDENTDCHEWMGCVHKGLLQVYVHALNRAVSGSNAISFLKTGAVAEKGTVWYAMCRNTLCLNPAHRKLGTLSEAWKHYRPELTVTHRAAITKGIRSSNAKLSLEIAAQVRASDESPASLAEKLSVHKSVIQRIRCNKAWRQAVPGSSVFAA